MIVPSDVLKIIKAMGYENFTTLVLPESHFWDEKTSQASRTLPLPSLLDLNRAKHEPLQTGSEQFSHTSLT